MKERQGEANHRYGLGERMAGELRRAGMSTGDYAGRLRAGPGGPIRGSRRGLQNTGLQLHRRWGLQQKEAANPMENGRHGLLSGGLFPVSDPAAQPALDG